MKHGTVNTYSRYGCRCDECVSVVYERNKQARERRRARASAGDPSVPHGARWTYADWGCRCDRCTEARRVYERERRGQQPRREFTDEEVAAAVEVYRTHGREVAAARLGVSASTVYKWARERGVRYERQFVHGTLSGWERGCRCDICRQGAAQKRRERKARRIERFRRGEVNPQHGKATTYSNYDCRCGPCSKAWSEWCAEYQARRKAS